MYRLCEPDEAGLTAALATDLCGSFERLVLMFQDRLYRFALRLTGSQQDAEEVAQDALFRAYRALAEYPAARIEVLALRPWLYRITLNVVRNRARGGGMPVISLDQDRDGPAQDVRADERAQPELAWERAEGRDELQTLVATLPERFREAVVLRHVEGLAYPEVAAVLNQPLGTVKANVHRGVRILRAALSQQLDRVNT